MTKRTLILFTVIALVSLTSTAVAQDELRAKDGSYKLPPQEVVDILDAPPTPMARVSPTGDAMLLATMDSMPSIAHMARPILRLGGVRIDPRSNARQRTSYFTELRILRIAGGSEIPIKLPAKPNVTSFGWSPDGQTIHIEREGDKGIELWVANPTTGKSRLLTKAQINAAAGGCEWMPDNRHLLCTLVPKDRGAPPRVSAVPVGPNVQETAGRVSTARTYQDLLTSPHDGLLFEHYMSAQPALVDARSGKIQKLGQPAFYRSLEPSPDSNYFLVQTVKQPYSYAVPYYGFPHSVEVWDSNWKLVHTLADLPSSEEVPIGGVSVGPRSVGWRPLKPATLVWAEALDEGNPKKEAEHRDKLMTLSAPFETSPEEYYRLQHRSRGISWLQSGTHALISEYDRDRRWNTTHLVNLDDSGDSKVVLDLSVQDRYNNPGNPVRVTTPKGESVVLQDGDWVYLSGRGSTPQGDRPLLQRMNLESLDKEEVFRSGEDSYESFIDFVGDSLETIITRHESPSEPPNYMLRDLKQGNTKSLTTFEDPSPQLRQMKKQLVKYEREDGVPLSGTLYLPPNHKKGERLPLIIWAYPREFNDRRTAGQVSGSPNRFTRMSGISHLFFATQGYAVLDGAQMPVIGDPETVNDTFVDQIVKSAEAAIKKLDDMGIADPNRVGVGGHSYGAFMTANLLAHCDLFKAGIARSGAYNRTLTPFGFQSERRTLWEAPDLYFKVSPFMHADKINEPILMTHGEMDNNSGTFPIQSRRLFHALKGHGATARLVFLPFESHGYRARESVMHTLAEMFEWFDKYVKEPPGSKGQ